jgi:hypothetical protein
VRQKAVDKAQEDVKRRMNVGESWEGEIRDEWECPRVDADKVRLVPKILRRRRVWANRLDLVVYPEGTVASTVESSSCTQTTTPVTQGPEPRPSSVALVLWALERVSWALATTH